MNSNWKECKLGEVVTFPTCRNPKSGDTILVSENNWYGVPRFSSSLIIESRGLRRTFLGAVKIECEPVPNSPITGGPR